MALVYFLFLLVISSATACDRCVHQSKATYSSRLSYAACGYGHLAVDFNNGQIASAPPSVYNNGAACGACFQVRCKNKALCRSKGTQVLVTHKNGDSETDFVLSTQAFKAMAKPGYVKEVLDFGTVDIEYKRVPCDYYKNKNLALRVEEYSIKPYYLAITVLYQGGQTEIRGIDVATDGTSEWQPMNHSYGAVWETHSIPTGALKFRFAVAIGYASEKFIKTKSVLPAAWKNAKVYDTGVQITDIAQEKDCVRCDYEDWK